MHLKKIQPLKLKSMSLLNWKIGVLNYQSEIALEFPELFPANEVAIKMGNSIVTTLKDMFIATNIATNNFETFIPLREFKASNFSSIFDEKRRFTS